MTSSQSQPEQVIDYTIHAIGDAQETIRAYDVKAQTLGILLTIALGVINFTIINSSHNGPVRIVAILGSIIGVSAIACLGFVLLPRTKSWKNIPRGNYTPSNTYFLSKSDTHGGLTVPEMVDRAIKADWHSELTYELMKLSAIRNAKHKSFVWALGFTAICLALIVALLILNIAGESSATDSHVAGDVSRVANSPSKAGESERMPAKN